MEGIIGLLSEGNFIKFNIRIAQECGADAAIVLGKLCTLVQIYGNPFFYELEKIAEETTLSEYRVRKALKALQEYRLINVDRKGIPPRNHYAVNADNLAELLIYKPLNFKANSLKNLTYAGEKTSPITNIDKENIDNKNIDIKNNKKTSTASVDSLIETVDDEQLKQALKDFCKMRKLIKKPVSDRAMQILLNKLNKFATDDESKIAILEQSIEHSWQSIYPLKADMQQPKQTGSYNPFVNMLEAIE